MFSTAEKTNHTSTAVHQKAQQQTFSRKAGEEMFFGGKEQQSFFNAPVQAKLTVSSPDDPQEKEADAVADQVMRMPSFSPSINDGAEKKIDKKEDEELAAKQQTTFGKAAPIVQLKAAGIYRSAAEPYDTTFSEAGTSITSSYINRKALGLYHSDTIQRSGRGPPATSIPFSQSLSSSKGAGSAMPDSSRQFMESRFNADFSGVRIHTGSQAQSLSSSINAQAFAHGNDIYFNEGKYSPGTQSGGTLLAHELTHTIQQGASPAMPQSKSVDRVVANKEISTQASTHIPQAVNNIVSKKTEEELSSADHDLFQAKQQLSNWSVNESGSINENVNLQGSEQENELQAKEEDVEEKEKSPAIAAKLLQRKAAQSLAASPHLVQSKTLSGTSSHIVQPQIISRENSLTDAAESGTIIAPRERGPPLQLSTMRGQSIQRSPVDDALAGTSVGALLDCVYVTDLDATSACLLRKARDVAMGIPGYRALRVILNSDPITGEYVARNGRNFLEAAFDIMPGGDSLFRKLEEQGQIDAAASWIDIRISGLTAIVNTLFSRFSNFWNRLGLTDFTSPLQVMREGAGIVYDFIGDIVNFAVAAAVELLGMVKDYLLRVLVDFIKERSGVYPLLTVILGEDPITKEPVERNGTNILNAILELGGEEGKMQRTQMEETGTFARIAGYIDEGIVVFGGLDDAILANFRGIWDIVTIDALMNPVALFTTIYNIFAEPINRVLDFITRVALEILALIKEVLMQRLSTWARGVRGYYLVTVIIGKDPFTDAIIDRNTENIIHGFMSLMEGGEEQFSQMKEAGSIDRATQQIDAAVARLNMTPESVVQLFVDLWNSFSLNDLVHPIEAFQRIIETFGEPIGRLIAFVVEVVRIIVVVILEIMNFPFDLIGNIINRTRAAFQSIKRDPIGFLKNLLRAIKQGFIQFFDNIVQHLISGVVGWLMSELRDAGIPELTDFSLQGVIGWVLEVLGISMEKIWEKLAAHPRVGPERVARLRGMIDTMEGIWTFIKDVAERGIVAIWEKIQEQLANLWNTVIDAVKNWVMQTIVAQVTARLLSMLDPTGIMAVINSAIAIYSAVQSFIKYLREMLEIINSFVNGVADIAEGNVTTAANYLENTMGQAMPIVIGFLANQVGLGGIGARVGEMIESVREMVDQALTWLVNKAVDTGMNILDRVMAAGRSAVGAVMGWWNKRAPVRMRNGEAHTLYLEQQGESYALMIQSTPATYSDFLTLELSRNGISNPANGTTEKVALDKAAEIDREISRYGRVEQEDRIAWGENVSRLMDQLADLTGRLSINLNVVDPPSVVRYGSPNQNGFATLMVAEMLSENNVTGQIAGRDRKAILGYDYAKTFQRISNAGAPYFLYVQGHLLNDNLGGYANLTNLTPIHDDMNKEHLHDVEEEVKLLVLGTRRAGSAVGAKKVVNYSVDVEYNGHPVRGSLINRFSQEMQSARRLHAEETRKTDPDPNLLRQFALQDEAAMNILAYLTYEESSLTTAFDCSWQELSYDVASSTWLPSGTPQHKRIPHRLPHTVEAYNLVKIMFTTELN